MIVPEPVGCLRSHSRRPQRDIGNARRSPRSAFGLYRIHRSVIGHHRRRAGPANKWVRHRRHEFREDIYGRDKALLALLNGDQRKVVDIPVERTDNIARRQALAISDLFWGDWGWSGGHHYAGGQKFFARLFGSSFAQSPPVPPRPLAQRGAQHR